MSHDQNDGHSSLSLKFINRFNNVSFLHMKIVSVNKLKFYDFQFWKILFEIWWTNTKSIQLRIRIYFMVFFSFYVCSKIDTVHSEYGGTVCEMSFP